MVRNYSKKTNRQEWSTESMNQAIKAVKEGEMGYRKASKQFNVPKSTLERQTKKTIEDPNYVINKKGGTKFQCVFSKEQEEELVKYLLNMECRLFGLTFNDLRTVAYQLAERNKLSHRFNSNTRMAGSDWIKSFLARHPSLTIRKPEATSGARAMGFNKVAIDQFFSLLEKSIDKHKLTGDRIYNCDESGVTVNPKSQSKIIALKGKRQVGSLTSSERGETVTSLVCMSAGGAFMPPMLIFPRKKKQQEFELGLPPGGWAEVSDSGWITTDLFYLWLKKFILFSKASKELPVLLILDGHSTHTKSLEIIDLARDKGVILLCLPPHTSHRLQPLDVTFFRPLSLYYGEEARKWLRCNPGRVLALFQISTIFGSAFIQAASMTTALKGFERTGIWPPDKSVFNESDFLPAAVTEINLESETALVENEKARPTPACDEESPDLEPKPTPASEEPQPGCSWMVTPGGRSAFKVASPEIVLPIPKTQCLKRSSRKRGKTAILTESPYKQKLEAEKKKRESIKIKKEEAKKKRENKAKIKLFKEIETNDKPKPQASKKRQIQENLAVNNTRKKKKHAVPSESEDDDDAACLYCGYFYSKSNEGWISCTQCKKWAHNSCAGVESEDDEAILICEVCKD